MKPRLLLILSLAAAPLLAGCQRFAANYVLDPRPPQAAYSDLKASPNPQPVLLTFDMRTAAGPFPEGTARFAPKVARVLEHSGVFSSVAKVGSESMPRLTIVLTEMAAATGSEVKSLPAGLSGGLQGSEAAVLYMFSGSYQSAGKEPVKKVYHHAIHVLNSKAFPPPGTQAMTGGQATDAMVEQFTLNFLRELQFEGKL